VKKQTYVAGKFSQIKLQDGSKFFVETGPVGIRIRKLGLIMPKELVWEYIFPFFIRTQWDSWELSEQVLDLVLTQCAFFQREQDLVMNIAQVEENLQVFVQENFDYAYAKTLQKAGIEAANEALENWRQKGYQCRERKPELFEQYATKLLEEVDQLTYQRKLTANQRLVLRACIDSAGVLADSCQTLKKSAGSIKQAPKDKSAEAFLYLCFSEVYIFSKMVLTGQGVEQLLGVSESELTEGLMLCSQIQETSAVDEIFESFSQCARDSWRITQLDQFALRASDMQLMEMLSNDLAARPTIMLTMGQFRPQVFALVAALLPSGLADF
jgi:hypothetical protein